jgi:membrane-associated phospholipid phosphatase
MRSQRTTRTILRGQLPIIAFISGALLILLTVAVVTQITVRVEMALVRAALASRSESLTLLIGILTFISSALPALATCAALSVLIWLRDTAPRPRSWRSALNATSIWRASFPVFAYLTTLGSNIIMRIAVGRMRPDVDYIPHLLPELQADFQRFSYPSGHAGAVFVTFAALAIVMWRYRAVRGLVLLISTIVILGVGFGRVYLGVHWVSDVLAGYLLGAMWLAIALHLTCRHTANRVS